LIDNRLPLIDIEPHCAAISRSASAVFASRDAASRQPPLSTVSIFLSSAPDYFDDFRRRQDCPPLSFSFRLISPCTRQRQPYFDTFATSV